MLIQSRGVQPSHRGRGQSNACWDASMVASTGEVTVQIFISPVETLPGATFTSSEVVEVSTGLIIFCLEEIV